MEETIQCSPLVPIYTHHKSAGGWEGKEEKWKKGEEEEGEEEEEEEEA